MGWETERGKTLSKYIIWCIWTVLRIIQTGANAWRNVKAVMAERNISNKLKTKVLDCCVVLASTYGLERGGRKVERKYQQQGPMETNYKSRPNRTAE